MLFDRPCAHVVASPNGRYLLASCQSHDPRIKGRAEVVMPISEDGAELTFRAGTPHKWRPDSSGFAYVDDDRHVVMFQALDGAPPRKLASLPERINAIAWSNDGASLLVSATQGLTDVVLLSEGK